MRSSTSKSRQLPAYDPASTVDPSLLLKQTWRECQQAHIEKAGNEYMKDLDLEIDILQDWIEALRPEDPTKSPNLRQARLQHEAYTTLQKCRTKFHFAEGREKGQDCICDTCWAVSHGKRPPKLVDDCDCSWCRDRRAKEGSFKFQKNESGFSKLRASVKRTLTADSTVRRLSRALSKNKGRKSTVDR